MATPNRNRPGRPLQRYRWLASGRDPLLQVPAPRNGRGPLRPAVAFGCFLVVLSAFAILAAGCKKEAQVLDLSDLDEGEARYVHRVVQMERARALTLANRPAGEAAFDSLSAAWGDSSLADTRAGIPEDPERSAAVNELLLRILKAEQDSLLVHPGINRLAVPLPEPPPPAKPEDEET